MTVGAATSFHQGNHKVLAQKLLQALVDGKKAKAMAIRAGALVREQYALGVALDRYVAVYEELLVPASCEA